MGDKMAQWLYSLLENMNKRPEAVLYNSKIREDLQTLEPAGNTPKRQKEYVLKKFSLCILILITGVFLTVIMWIKSANSTEIVDNLIKRKAYGEGYDTVCVVADDGEEKYNISFEVEEKSFTDDELEKLLSEFEQKLDVVILGENESLERVERDLKLPAEITNYPFDIMWATDESIIDNAGRLVGGIFDKPQKTTIYATIEYSNQSGERVSIEKKWECMVIPNAVNTDNAELIKNEIKAVEKDSRSSEYMTLPSEINKLQISWSYPKKQTALMFLIGTPLIIILIYFSMDRDLHQKVKDREEEMRIDYPEIVSSLALLIGAGMNVQNAWLKIVKDYRAKREETGKKRYAYEEMLFTVYEMENGVLQTNAYEHFGRRCRISCYTRLSTLISQNLKKGATNLAELLKEEAQEAFEERKHTARKLGEKAGTKLLLPMMMILGVMMLIIMIPAFKTMF